jgi:hypothetical protein
MLQDHILWSVIIKFFPQMSFLCFWEKTALINWKTLNIYASHPCSEFPQQAILLLHYSKDVQSVEANVVKVGYSLCQQRQHKNIFSLSYVSLVEKVHLSVKF